MSRSTARRNARAQPAGYNFDFNRVRVDRSAQDAENVTRDQIEKLFAALDQADERLPANARAALDDALRAFVKFLYACEPNGSLGRVFAILHDEYRTRVVDNRGQIRPGPPGQILSGLDAGSGGGKAGNRKHFIKAAAAFAVESLYLNGELSVEAAAAEIAEKLAAHGFPFGTTRKDGITVQKWRRDFQRKWPHKIKKGRNKGREQKAPAPVPWYRGLCANPSACFTLNGNPSHDRAAIHRWFVKKLVEAGYETPD